MQFHSCNVALTCATLPAPAAAAHLEPSSREAPRLIAWTTSSGGDRIRVDLADAGRDAQEWTEAAWKLVCHCMPSLAQTV